MQRRSGSLRTPPNLARFSRICLECAAIFGHSAVNLPVSAWGLYKSDDEHTHSDDLCCSGHRRGGKLARSRAELSGAFRSDLFDGSAALSTHRLSVGLSP